MSDDSSDEDGAASVESEAPSSVILPSANLRQSSLFESAGVKPPAKRDGGPGGDVRYERLSSLALELDGFRETADGANSSLFSGESAKKKKPSKRRTVAAMDSDVSVDDMPQKKKKPSDVGVTNDIFGELGVSDEDESASVFSTQSARDEARKRIFPVKNISCLGCALPQRMAPIETFVRDNIEKMAPEALWRLAALTWINQVCKPCKAEGVDVPRFSWKCIRLHYMLHSTDPIVAKHFTVRQLQTMRFELEGKMVKLSGKDRELDRQTVTTFLQVTKQETAERSSLASLLKKANAGAASTVGDK